MILILASITVITIATLYPFNFNLHHILSLSDFLANFNHASSFRDQLNNILLFMPLGFSGGNFLRRFNLNLGWQFLLLLFLCASLSFTVETLQILLPSRSPTPTDIISNTLGGCLGLLAFYIWNYQILSNNLSQSKSYTKKLLHPQNTIFFLAYMAWILIISIFWTNVTNLSNWDGNFPLLLGNENTRNRSWQGYISDVYIADKEISQEQIKQSLLDPNYLTTLDQSLIAHYQLNSQDIISDQTGKLTNLVWQGNYRKNTTVQGAFLSSQQWLKTEKPVKYLSQKISKTSQFTISLNLASDDLQQTGSARILSISENVLKRNLTIGQQKTSLEIRVRTPITGENGTDLQIIIPGVFTDTKFHHLIITYNNGNIHVFLDKIQNQYSLNLLELIPLNQKLFYYSLTFIPLGASLAILNIVANYQQILSKAIFTLSVLLPGIFLEFLLINLHNKSLSFINICLGIIFTIGTMLIFKVRGKYLHNCS
jgi:VanZ family protein